MRLFIAEKKNLGEVIAQAIGNGTNKGSYIDCGSDIVTWGSGHLLESVPPERHNPAYAKWDAADLPLKLRPRKLQPIERTANQLKTVMSLMEKASEIVHAGDPDGEGQLLIDEILEYECNTIPVKRVLMNVLNAEKSRQGLGHLRDNIEFYGLSQSALARSIADELYGFNMTRAYSLAAQKIGVKTVLAVGRVMTPILGMIVHRYEAFTNHVAGAYYTVTGDFLFNGAFIPARLAVPENAPVDEKNRITEKDYADNIAATVKGQTATVLQAGVEAKTTPAPLPFSLLDLQIKMSKEHGISGEDTLKVTQALRDNFKAITYNRSDCRYLSTEQFNDASDTLDAIQRALSGTFSPDVLAQVTPSQKSRAFNDAKITAHTAIIPTSTVPDTAKMSRNELLIYTAIATQYVLQFLPLKGFDAATATLRVGDFDFKIGATHTTEPGWTALIKEESESEDGSAEDNSESLFDSLAALRENATGTCDSITIKAEKTKPLPLYTEATLMADLQRVARYVKDPRIKALLISKDKGTEGENGGIGMPATRTGIIEKLKQKGFFVIEKKKVIPTELGISFIHSLPDIATEPDMTALWHEQQKLIEKGELSCDAFLDELEVFISEQLENVDVSKITAPKSAEKSTQRERLGVPCPACGGDIVVTPKVCGCTKCNFKIWSTLAGKTLTKGQIETLISKGKTAELKGYTSTKTGKNFSAFVVLKDKATGQTTFEFPPRK